MAVGRSQGNARAALWCPRMQGKAIEKNVSYGLLYKFPQTGRITFLEHLIIYFIKCGSLSIIKCMVILSTIKEEESAHMWFIREQLPKAEQDRVASFKVGQMSSKVYHTERVPRNSYWSLTWDSGKHKGLGS